MNKQKKAIIASILITVIYSIISYYLMNYYAGLFSAVLCLPFILTLFISYGFGDNLAYFFLILTVILIWYFVYLIVKRILKV